ncbi:MAG: hypothetical protein KAG98_00650, partial [Lentisphaeria bacterium]|nr:hypothetical protein [Lentisphaeria bacterium]
MKKKENEMKKSKLFMTSIAGVCLVTLSACTTTGSTTDAVEATPVAPKVLVPGAVVTQDGNLLFVATGESVAKVEDGALGVVKAKVA